MQPRSWNSHPQEHPENTIIFPHSACRYEFRARPHHLKAGGLPSAVFLNLQGPGFSAEDGGLFSQTPFCEVRILR